MSEIKELSDRARRFAEEYLIDFNAQKAYARAGYAPNPSGPYTLLRDPRVDALIREGKRRASERARISQDWVLEKLRRIAEGSPIDYFAFEPDPDDPTKMRLAGLDVANLTDDQRDALRSIKFTRNGPAIETHDKVAALKLIGQYLGLFTDKHEISGPGGAPLMPTTIKIIAAEDDDS